MSKILREYYTNKQKYTIQKQWCYGYKIMELALERLFYIYKCTCT